jgi:hypothetical protein
MKLFGNDETVMKQPENHNEDAIGARNKMNNHCFHRSPFSRKFGVKRLKKSHPNQLAARIGRTESNENSNNANDFSSSYEIRRFIPTPFISLLQIRNPDLGNQVSSFAIQEMGWILL